MHSSLLRPLCYLIVLSLFYFHIQPSLAYPPFDPRQGTSSTSFPYTSFTGTLTSYQEQSLLTVPSDKVFIVTNGIIDQQAVDLYADSQVILNGSSGIFSDRPSGDLHLVINSTSILKIKSQTGTTASYYLEGYYAEPTNQPFINATGSIQSGQQLTLLNVPSDKQLVITRVTVNGINVHLYEDNTLRVSGKSRAFYNATSLFNRGKAHVLFASGSTVRLYNDGPYTRHYYVEGYYISP